MEITESEKLRRLEQSKSDKIKAEQRKYLRKRTPLFDALTNVTKTKKRINEGWDVNHLADNQLTPLFHAIKIGAKREIIELLINSGAKVKLEHLLYVMKRETIKSTDSFFFYLYKVCNPSESDFKKLLHEVFSDMTRGYNSRRFLLNELIKIAKKSGFTNLSDVVNGAEINYWPFAFTHIRDKGDKERKVFRFMLEHGLNIDICDRDGRNLLMEVAYYGEKQDVELLIKNGANLNHKDKKGCPILVGLIDGGNKENAKLLIQAGADVNVVDERGRTPLFLAVTRGYEDIEQLLIKTGAK